MLEHRRMKSNDLSKDGREEVLFFCAKVIRNYYTHYTIYPLNYELFYYAIFQLPYSCRNAGSYLQALYIIYDKLLHLNLWICIRTRGICLYRKIRSLVFREKIAIIRNN